MKETLSAALCLALVLVACGDDTSDDTASETGAAETDGVTETTDTGDPTGPVEPDTAGDGDGDRIADTDEGDGPCWAILPGDAPSRDGTCERRGPNCWPVLGRKLDAVVTSCGEATYGPMLTFCLEAKGAFSGTTWGLVSGAGESAEYYAINYEPNFATLDAGWRLCPQESDAALPGCDCAKQGW